MVDLFNLCIEKVLLPDLIFFFFFFFVDFSDGSHSFKGPAGIACHAFEHLIEVAFY